MKVSLQKIKNSKIAGIFLVVFIALVYILTERALNEGVWLSFLFGNPDMGYKVSSKIGIGVWVLFFIYALCKKMKFRKNVLFFICFYFITLVFSTLLNGLNLNRLANTALNTCSVLFLICMFCQNKEDAKNFVSVISCVYLVLTALNMLSMLIPGFALWVGKNDQQCFIGNYDTSGFAVELGFFYIFLDDYLNNSVGTKIKLVLYSVFFVLDAYAVLHISGTTIIGAFLILLYLLLPLVKKIAQKTNLMVFFLIGVLFFVVLVWFIDPITHFKPVSFIIEKVLKKSLTMSKRTIIWPAIFNEYVSQKPIAGYGVDVSSGLQLFTLDHYVFHTNNQFMQTWYEAGLIGLAGIVALFAETTVCLKKSEDKKFSGIVKYMLFVFLIVYNGDIMPGYNWTSVFEICTVAYMLSPIVSDNGLELRQ